MNSKYWWIKERSNPQLGTYFVAMGNIPLKEAIQHEKSLYGHNTMHRYKSKNEYDGRLAELKQSGEKVQ